MHALHIISYVALGVTAILLLLVLFEPPVRYRVKAPSLPLDSEEFLRILASLSDAQPHRDSAIALLAGGRAFYPAQVEAIRGATRSVHLEAFIFHPGPIGDRFLDALDRARCGVDVKVIVDYVGSMPTPDRYFPSVARSGAGKCAGTSRCASPR